MNPVRPLTSVCPIDSPEAMVAAIRHFGILPFFRCGVPGWSVEELTAPGCWFSDEEDTFLGPWDWKIDAVREGDITYGKFLGGKAAFATVEWYRELMNWRRSQPRYRMAEGGRYRATTAHDKLMKRLAPVALGAIREAGALEARELRLICSANEKAPVMDSVIQFLQMGTWTVIGDFERVYRGPELTYRGWQRASNTTPDELFAAPALPLASSSLSATSSSFSVVDPLATALTPAASRARLIAHIREFFPVADLKLLEKLF